MSCEKKTFNNSDNFLFLQFLYLQFKNIFGVFLMRLLIVAILMVGLSLSATAQKPDKAAKSTNPATIELKTFEDSVAYAIGINVGNSLLKDDLLLDVDIIKAGLNDVLYTKKEKLSKEELDRVFQAFSAQIQEKQMQKQAQEGTKNLLKGRNFMEENKKKPGVKVTPSGLQYEVITDGTGAKPVATDKVKVHYVGTLLDGSKFDSSVDRGEPVTFPLGNVIKGWTEGLQLMPVGSKYRFFIPADLGYGERGAPGGQIGPNETLIFEVELINIEQ